MLTIKDKYLVTLLKLSVVGLVARLFLSLYFTYYPDLNTFQLWSLDLVRYGFSKFYTIADSDYLPGYIYALWFTGKAFFFVNAKITAVAPEVIYKLPSMCTDIGNTFFAYLLLKRFTSRKAAFWTSVFILFNPALMLNSVFWGQVESYVTFFVLASFYFLITGRFSLSAAFLAFGQASKPVVMLVLPFYLLYQVTTKTSFKQIAKYALLSAGCYLLLFLPFKGSRGLLEIVVNRNVLITSFRNFVTIGALNFWALVMALSRGSIEKIPDTEPFLFLSYKVWGMAIFAVVYLVSLTQYCKKLMRNRALGRWFLFSFTAVFWGMFMFITRMHERHAYYGLFFLNLSLPYFSSAQKTVVVFANVLYAINILFAYTTAGIVDINFSRASIALFAFAYLFAFLYFFKVFYINGKR